MSTSLIGSEVIVFEKVATTEQTCNLGHTHRNVDIFRRYVLAVVDQRVVPNHWTAAWGQPQDATGLRAFDQFGDEWLQDWDGCNGDGPGPWRTTDGRTAERGHGPFPSYDRPPAHDGYIIENQEHQA